MKMVGQVAVESEGLLRRARQPAFADPISAVVSSEEQVGRGLGVMGGLGHVTSTGLEPFDGYRSVVAGQSPGRALNEKLGPAHRGNVALDELRFPPPSPTPLSPHFSA